MHGHFLGKYQWWYKTSDDDLCNTSGVTDVWRNPNATREQLLAEYKSAKVGGVFLLRQWQAYKEGRRMGVREIEIRRYYV